MAQIKYNIKNETNSFKCIRNNGKSWMDGFTLDKLLFM